jgi:hypothetical protein
MLIYQKSRGGTGLPENREAAIGCVSIFAKKNANPLHFNLPKEDVIRGLPSDA